MENLSAQTIERYQIMMSTEVMKNFPIMNRASVREIMLQHEKTFKEQVHDLHKLCEVQRLLMDKAKGTGLDFYLGVPSPSPTHHLHPLPEGPDQSTQKGNFWGQIPTDGVAALKADVLRQLPDTQKTVKENNILLEDRSKSTNSPVKKRKIDLEQLPEDDTDDEIEKSENVLIPALVNLVEKPKDFTIGYTGLESTVKSCPSPNHGTGVHPSQLAKLSQVNSLVTGENSYPKNHTSASRVASVYPSQFGKPPKLPLDLAEAEQTPQVIEEKNMDFQNPSLLSTGGCTGKSMALFLPQTDVIDRASQDTRRETHWFFQASDASMNPLSTPGFSSHQKQVSVPHPLLPEPSFKENHQHNGIPQGHLNLGQRQLSSKPAPTEDASSTFGNWSKASVEKKSPVLAVGAHEGRLFSSQERSDNGSRWFTTEAYSQGCQLASVIPAVGVDMRASEGDQSTSGSVVPVLSVVNGKGQNQEQDTNLWYSENPVMQLSQYQQQPMFRPQVFPSVNQALWLQSSQSTHGGLHPQQMVYGVHTTDASQVGFRAEGLQRGQGDMTVPWNMLGLGHYYSSVPSVPQRPPFKKPPKLVLKNDGGGMELKLVSPERESSEKASQRKPSNPSKDLPQESLKAQERKGGVQRENKEEDMKHGETAKSTGVNIQSSTVQAREASKTSSMPLQPKILTTVTATHTQEMLLPKKILEHMTASVYVSHGLAAPVTVSSVAQSDTGAAANTDSFTTNAHNVIASSDTVSALPYESEAQQGIHQAEIVMPQQDQVKVVEKSTPWLEGKEARFAKEMLLQGAVRINEDMQDLALSGQGSSLVPCKDDIEGSVTGCNNNKSRDQSDSEHVQISTSSRNSEDMKSPSNKVLMPKGNVDNVNVTGQPSPFSAKSQDSNLKNMEESGNVASVWEKRAEELHVNHCRESVLPSKNKIDAFRDDHGHMTFDSSLGSVKYSQARADGFSLDSRTGSHLIHGVATGSSGNDDAQTKNLLQGSLRGHGSDLMSTSRQLTMQAVSTQSTSTETPGIMKQERTRSSKVLESDVCYKVSEKGSSSSVHKNKSATPNSDGGCLSVPSIKPTILQSKPDATVGASSEDFHHDSDSDSLAATILLSFAPMIDQQNPKKHLTEDACKTVGSSRKHMSAEHASSRTRQTGVRLTKGVMGIQCKSFESGDDQGSRVKVQCSSRRMDHVEPIRLATKDRFREEQLSTELQSDDGGEEVIKNARSKLSKAVSLGSPVNDEPIATLKSKQLNKLSVAVVNSKNVDTHDHTMSYKGKDVFHTPTGHRSSRGPPMAARVHHGSRGRTQQQLQHYSDEEGGSPSIAEVYSRSREEGGGSPRNAQGSMKSKAWGDPNRKRSRPRSQFHNISHRKTQR